jgi:preprotein translocase subunit SecG
MLITFLDIVHVLVCSALMFIVLLQQGKGGGMGAAFGGGASAQVFGGRGAGNLLTRATAIFAGTFMLTSVSLAYLSSSGDRALRARAAMEEHKASDKGTARPKEPKPETKTDEKAPDKPAEGPVENAPETPTDTPK